MVRTFFLIYVQNDTQCHHPPSPVVLPPQHHCQQHLQLVGGEAQPARKGGGGGVHEPVADEGAGVCAGALGGV